MHSLWAADLPPRKLWDVIAKHRTRSGRETTLFAVPQKYSRVYYLYREDDEQGELLGTNEVISWCAAHGEKIPPELRQFAHPGDLNRAATPHAPPDGPEPPNQFRWHANTCGGLSALQFQFLVHMWNRGRRRRCVSFEELLCHVWTGKDTLAASIKTFVSRLDTKLNRDARPRGIYLGLGTENRNVTCTWPE
jgi:hypothetical protein